MTQIDVAECDERRRNLLFMRTPEWWDAWPFLPVVRRQAGCDEELGLLYDVFHWKGVPGYAATVFRCNLFLIPPEEEFLQLPKETYDRIEEVYEAGWRVD
jgi:hypothetical protein